MIPRLEILIASVYARTPLLVERLDVLAPQLSPYVRVLVDRDDGEAPVGVKRTRLVRAATADYVCFIDDDDWVPSGYVDRIITALQAEPDCVGFVLAYCEDNHFVKNACHSIRYDRWGETESVFERTPNHLNPVRRRIAVEGLPFRDGFGEDRDWSERIRPLLGSEVFLPMPPLYIYKHSLAGSLFGGGVRSLGYDPGLPEYGFVRVLEDDSGGVR